METFESGAFAQIGERKGTGGRDEETLAVEKGRCLAELFGWKLLIGSQLVQDGFHFTLIGRGTRRIANC